MLFMRRKCIKIINDINKYRTQAHNVFLLDSGGLSDEGLEGITRNNYLQALKC